MGTSVWRKSTDSDGEHDQSLFIIERLSEVGIALSNEEDPHHLLELILLAAKDLTGCDGGSVYKISEDSRSLEFEIIRTDSLGIAMGGTTGTPITFPPMPLTLEDGSPNLASVVASAVLKDCTINIVDAYDDEEYDFSGTRAFDEQTGYRSKSFLTVPMKNHEGKIIGVLQLINAHNTQKEIVVFGPAQQRLAESLASQGAMALTRNQLIEDMGSLFESFIKLIATAIDDKSPYTGDHCRRVPELTMLIAKAVSSHEEGPLANFEMSDEDNYELNIAAWLHDCGKITTPEWVMDKATKLHSIFDRIELIATRMEVLRRDAEIERLRGELAGGDPHALQKLYEQQIARIDEQLAFLRNINKGGEFMSDELIEQLNTIAGQTWTNTADGEQPLLTTDEVKNLSIRRGTLTDEERNTINHHIVATIKMLESLPYPDHLKRVPEYAGGHHERMDGKGYPKGLTADCMSVQARMMAVADIFEALTASDRPYKDAMPLSKSLAILKNMSETGHIDPDIYQVFIDQKVYALYAERHLKPEQIDI